LRQDDLFTAGLLSSYITWKLSGSDEVGSEAHALVLVSRA
jgi:hypothetical protein